MRLIFALIGLLLFNNGCKENSDTITSVKEDGKIITSANQVSNDLQYTLSTPKASFGIHDTLIAAVSVYNQASVSETLLVGPVLFKWSLKNDSGRTILSGPTIVPLYLYSLVLSSHQSKEIYFIHQAIADISGQPVIPGPYVLNVSIGSISLSLNLLLRETLPPKYLLPKRMVLVK
jgi:hypothetical protein